MMPEVQGVRPVAKFASVKALVFLGTLQGFVIGVLSSIGVFDKLAADHHDSVGRVTVDITYMLILVEMMFLAIVHFRVFPADDFKRLEDVSLAVSHIEEMDSGSAHPGRRDIHLRDLLDVCKCWDFSRIGREMRAAPRGELLEGESGVATEMGA
mmetsp:Transcript_80303/g.183996  ORF Transcript_80303/g.183996 Transcript_80303/m.183996 type:complete len:154 (-) Transcript_80303:62-523(-)